MRIPRPDEFLAKQLSKAPRSVQIAVDNVIAVLMWLGLPVAVISFVADRAWVVLSFRWVLDHVGLLRPFFVIVGQVCVAIVAAWHELTLPIVRFLSVVFQLDVPHWAIDLGTIAALFIVGRTRTAVMLRLAEDRLARDFVSTVKEIKKSDSESQLPEDSRQLARKLVRLSGSGEVRKFVRVAMSRVGIGFDDLTEDPARLKTVAHAMVEGMDTEEDRGDLESQVMVMVSVASIHYQERKKANIQFIAYGIAGAFCLAVLIIDWVAMGAVP